MILLTSAQQESCASGAIKTRAGVSGPVLSMFLVLVTYSKLPTTRVPTPPAGSGMRCTSETFALATESGPTTGAPARRVPKLAGALAPAHLRK